MKAEVNALRDAITLGREADALAMLGVRPELAKDWRPVLEAALYGRTAILERLLALGADPDAQSSAEARYRPLHRAVEPKKSIPRHDGHRACIDRLIDAGADIDGLGCWYDGRPLETAAREGMRGEADHLLARGARRDIVSAVLTGDEGLLAAEIAADPGSAACPTPARTAPMHLLCAGRIAAGREVALAERLLAAGASATEAAVMRHGTFVPLHFATFRERADLSLVDWLIDHGAAPHDGLYETMWCGDFAAADLLVRRGADVNGAWAFSQRPLLLEMVQWGRNDAAFWLLDHGSDPRQRDAKGWTVLHYAAHRGASPKVVERLLAAGADPSIAAEGKTAAQIAHEKGKSALAALL